MAWFDYVGGIASGLQSVAQQQLKESAARTAEELARIDPSQPLTPEQVKRYGSLLGAGSFVKGDDNQWRLRERPEQQVARESAMESLAKTTAKRNVQKLIQGGTWTSLPLEEKKRRALVEADLPLATPGLFNADEIKKLLAEDPVTQAKLLLQGEEYAAKLKEIQEKSKNEQADKLAQMAAQLLRSAVVNTPEEARRMAAQLMQTQTVSPVAPSGFSIVGVR